MKRFLLSITAVCAALSLNAQVDTLDGWWGGTPALYSDPAGGYLAGNNSYGDLGVYQRFDDAAGIVATGQLTGVLMWVGAKDDNGGSMDVVVRDFTGGALGATLATETVTLAAVDTSLAGVMVTGSGRPYNLAVTFSSPVPVTSASDIVVGIMVPTTAGDTIGLVTNSDGDFTAAAGYSIVELSDNSVGSLADWGITIASAIFPIISFDLGVDEETMNLSVYPNPAQDVLNITADVEFETVNIVSADGKVVASSQNGGFNAAINIASLNSGVYFYEVVTSNGSVVRNSFVKK